MKDVMVDIECWGFRDRPCIVQLGACYFDRLTADIGPTFSVNVDARSAVREGAVIDADTVYWWLQQSDEARKSIIGDGLDIKEAMSRLNDFLSPAKHIWSHATFDFAIITNVLAQLNIPPKFSYRSSRDIRTLVALSNVPKTVAKREGVHHNALDDCKFQVQYCVEVLKGLK